LFSPARIPSPYGGGNIMDQIRTVFELMDTFHNPKTEFGSIDGDDRLGTKMTNVSDSLTESFKKRRQFFYNINVPHKREFFHGEEALQPLLFHQGPPNTCKTYRTFCF